MYYILFYKTIDNYIEKRAPFRNDHLHHVQKAHERGELVMAGALDDPPDSAILVFKGDNPDAARKFAQNDPYVKNGLISKWYIRPWRIVVGNE